MRISDWSSDVCSSDLNTIMLESTMPALMRTKTGTLGKVSSPPYGPVHPRLNEIGGSALARPGEQGQHRRLQPFGQLLEDFQRRIGLALLDVGQVRCGDAASFSQFSLAIAQFRPALFANIGRA